MIDRDENLPAEMARQNWMILSALVLVSLLWRSWPMTTGVLAGGLLITLNYHWMGRTLHRLLDDPSKTAKRKGGSSRNALLRLVVVGLVIYVLLVYTPIHPLGFVVGLSVYVLNLALTAVKRLY